MAKYASSPEGRAVLASRASEANTLNASPGVLGTMKANEADAQETQTYIKKAPYR